MSNPKLWKYPNSRGGAGNIVASIGERLGWQKCGTCEATGEICPCQRAEGSPHPIDIGHTAVWVTPEGKQRHVPCPDCVDGWTPPAELVERMLDAQDRAESGWSGPHSGKWGEDQIASMRAALLEQARWIGEQ